MKCLLEEKYYHCGCFNFFFILINKFGACQFIPPNYVICYETLKLFYFVKIDSIQHREVQTVYNVEDLYGHSCMVVWYRPLQSVHITTEVASFIPACIEMFSIPFCWIKFVIDLGHVSGFLNVLSFPPTTELTAII